MLMKKASILALAAVCGLGFFSQGAKADAFDFLKGCLVLGGVGVGGTAMAGSQSGTTIRDTQSLVVAGVTSCLIGGFISADIAKKAELTAGGELTMANTKLKDQVYSVMHDLCVMKHTCGPDGLPLPEKEAGSSDDAGLPPMGQQGKEGLKQYLPLSSGNVTDK